MQTEAIHPFPRPSWDPIRLLEAYGPPTFGLSLPSFSYLPSPYFARVECSGLSTGLPRLHPCFI